MVDSSCSWRPGAGGVTSVSRAHRFLEAYGGRANPTMPPTRLGEVRHRDAGVGLELPALVQHVLERLHRAVALRIGEVEDLLQGDPDVGDVLLDVAALVVLGAQALPFAHVRAQAP